MYLSFRRNFIVFSDSLSVLHAIRNRNWKNPHISQILLLHHSIIPLGKKIILFRIPSHMGIVGNERADLAAKHALDDHITEMTIPFSDFKPHIYNYLKNSWQKSWDLETNNKLHKVKSSVREITPIHSDCRREDVAITRLRLGHTYMTHSYLHYYNQMFFSFKMYYASEPLSLLVFWFLSSEP